MNWLELLGTPIAQLIAMVISGGGIAWLVGYALEWVNWDARIEKAIAAVLTTVLTATIVSIASLIPAEWQAMKLLDAILALVAALAALVGGWKFGRMKAEQHFYDLQSDRRFNARAVAREERGEDPLSENL